MSEKTSDDYADGPTSALALRENHENQWCLCHESGHILMLRSKWERS